jgi:cephalosporin hydroxylase
MPLFERIKANLSESQRRRLKRLRYFLKLPLRQFRSDRTGGRLDSLPDGRTWRSDIPLGLHYSFQEGTLGYRYRGVPMLKHPVEIALYMRLIWQAKPRTIIEIGSNAGGAALWFSDLLRTFGIEGEVVSIDVKPPAHPPQAANLSFLSGDANDLGRTLTQTLLSTFGRPFLVIEDASHQYAATLAVLRFFEPLMRNGEYIVVEDGNVSEMGDDARFDGGPARAIGEFLPSCSGRFVIDSSYCDHFGYNATGNPNGYLRCIREPK